MFKDALNALSGLVGGASLKEPVKSPNGKNFFDAPGVTIDNEKIARMGDLCMGKKAILVVNVASKWGLTDSNYKELVQIYDEFKGQGFEIIAYPCNQFGSQEPGTAKEIQDF